ncbi:MAG: type II toxin-antitoxin system PemK/MazF family toxin [Thermoanaerobaculia bacterium]|nr:type II toxin-antitoxin system PemK/MazF family toxin [Thermoanaerobaculia bacterium]
MRRGDLFRVRRPGGGDPKQRRIFVVASREALIRSRFSTVVCAPIYSRWRGLATEVLVGPEEGLRHESSILCDALASLPKAVLTDYLGSLSPPKMREFDDALRVALAVEW